MYDTRVAHVVWVSLPERHRAPQAPSKRLPRTGRPRLTRNTSAASAQRSAVLSLRLDGRLQAMPQSRRSGADMGMEADADDAHLVVQTLPHPRPLARRPRTVPNGTPARAQLTSQPSKRVLRRCWIATAPHHGTVHTHLCW